MPALLVLGASVVLRKGDTTRELALDDFYIAYQQTALQPGEFVERILIPLPTGDERVASYKLSKRFDQDISAVCAAFRLVLDGDKVTDIRIAYGGMAEIPKRAAGAEAVLSGASWNTAAVTAAGDALADDYTPISDMRSSAGYRMQASANLLRRFYLETSGVQTERVYEYGR
jgi:xanthine dehydrogenase small subunit